MCCIEQKIQQFFAPAPTAWSAPASLDALDAAVLRRLRYIAVCPLGVTAWFVAAFAVGGPSATRGGTLLGAVVQAVMMLGARAHRVAAARRAATDAAMRTPRQRRARRHAAWRARRSWRTSSRSSSCSRSARCR